MSTETPAPPTSGESRLGPFRVHADAERVALYRRETGFAEGAEAVVPAAFPIVWLCEATVAAAIGAALAGDAATPVHEQQSFFYFAPLRVGESYELFVALRREAEPPRLALNASVATLAGETVLHAETLLRLVPRPSGLEAPA